MPSSSLLFAFHLSYNLVRAGLQYLYGNFRSSTANILKYPTALELIQLHLSSTVEHGDPIPSLNPPSNHPSSCAPH